MHGKLLEVIGSYLHSVEMSVVDMYANQWAVDKSSSFTLFKKSFSVNQT